MRALDRFLAALVVLGLVASADAAVVTSVKSKFYCDSQPGSQISVTVKITDGTATEIKWKGKNLTPNSRMKCGYGCVLYGSQRLDNCADVDASGKWKYTSQDAAPLECTGLAPIAQVNPPQSNVGFYCSLRIE